MYKIIIKALRKFKSHKFKNYVLAKNKHAHKQIPVKFTNFPL